MPASKKASSELGRIKKPPTLLPLKMVMPFSRELMAIWMLASDTFALIMAGWVSIQIRSWLGNSFKDPESYYTLAPLLLIFLFAYSVSGLYPGTGLNPIEEMRRTIKTTIIAVVTLSVIAFLSKTGAEFSRLVFIFFGIISILVVPVNRFIAKKLASILGLWGEAYALIGFGPQGKKIYRYLKQNPLYGIRLVVLVNSAEHSELDSDEEIDLPEISFSIFEKDKMFLARKGIRSAILIPNEIPADLGDLFVDEKQIGLKKLIIISSLNWVGGNAVIPHDLGGLLGLEVERNLLNPQERLFKRMLDAFFMFFGCIIGIPIFLLCALLIFLDSPGPIFYKHERIGKDGQPIRLWKFRTMIQNADKNLEVILSQNLELREEWNSSYKLKNDPRVTRVGKLLRKTSLDELPQFINILAGEMSLIGPRPIINEEVKFYKERFLFCNQVLPGITGLWQISGRSDSSYDDRVSLDEYYIRHWSIWMDIYILIRTIWVVIMRFGAY